MVFRKKLTTIISMIAAFLLMMCFAYDLLLYNSHSANIECIFNYAQHLGTKTHILILALLPIYISAVIFGAGFFSIYLSSILDHCVFKKLKYTLIKRKV